MKFSYCLPGPLPVQGNLSFYINPGSGLFSFLICPTYSRLIYSNMVLNATVFSVFLIQTKLFLMPGRKVRIHIISAASSHGYTSQIAFHNIAMNSIRPHHHLLSVSRQPFLKRWSAASTLTNDSVVRTCQRGVVHGNQRAPTYCTEAYIRHQLTGALYHLVFPSHYNSAITIWQGLVTIWGSPDIKTDPESKRGLVHRRSVQWVLRGFATTSWS